MLLMFMPSCSRHGVAVLEKRRAEHNYSNRRDHTAVYRLFLEPLIKSCFILFVLCMYYTILQRHL